MTVMESTDYQKGFHRTCNDRADNAELLANWILAKEDIPVVEFNDTLKQIEICELKTSAKLYDILPASKRDQNQGCC